MLRRNRRPRSSSKTSAGNIPATPIPAISSAPTPDLAISERAMSQTLLHHCSGSSSAQPGRSENRSTGRLSIAKTSSGNRMRMPMVEVVPMSMPRTQVIFQWRLLSAQLLDRVHESADAGSVDRVPGVAIHFEVGADNDAVGDRKDFGDIIDSDAGIGKHRNLMDCLADLAQIRLIGGLSGDRSRNQNRVGKRRENCAFCPQFYRPGVERMSKFGIDIEQQL